MGMHLASQSSYLNRVCIYVDAYLIVITFSRLWASTGMVANPHLWSAVQGEYKIIKFARPRLRLGMKLVSLDGFGRPVPRQARSLSKPRLNRVLTFCDSTATGSVPRLSDQPSAAASTAESPPAQDR